MDNPRIKTALAAPKGAVRRIRESEESFQHTSQFSHALYLRASKKRRRVSISTRARNEDQGVVDLL